MNLSDNLKKIRKENNLSQEQLAEKLGVSRQAVSKWESNLAYPEMDKVLQICNMFDLNIDELLNQNVKEVKKNKQSKLNINKYIDSFLNYITKTINMLSSMTFKNQVKCIFEQGVIIAFMFIVAVILKELLFDTIIVDLLSIFPESIYYAIFGFVKDLFLVAYIIFCTILLLHIFKIRYLDYYEFSFKDEDENDNDKIEENEEIKIKEDNKENEIKNEDESHEKIKKSKKFLKRDREKIIIRDPKHSEYKFMSGLFKCLLLCIKAFVIIIDIFILIGLFTLIVLLTLSFVIAKSGLLFVGVVISLLATIIITIEFLLITFNFILDKKTNKNNIALYILIPIIILPIGVGLSIMSFKDFKIIDSYDGKYIIKDEVTYKMDKDLLIYRDLYYLEDEITYVESDNKDVRIEFEHLPYCKIKVYTDNNKVTYNNYCYDDVSMIDGIKYMVNLINKKVLINPNYTLHTYVYTTKENINILKSNMKKYYEDEEKEYYEDRINELINNTSELNSINNELEQKINDLENQLNEKNIEIDSNNQTINELNQSINELQNQINEYENINNNE